MLVTLIWIRISQVFDFVQHVIFGCWIVEWLGLVSEPLLL